MSGKVTTVFPVPSTLEILFYTSTDFFSFSLSAFVLLFLHTPSAPADIFLGTKVDGYLSEKTTKKETKSKRTKGSKERRF